MGSIIFYKLKKKKKKKKDLTRQTFPKDVIHLFMFWDSNFHPKIKYVIGFFLNYY